jgi:23S rRNA (adenine1618-N6)-methyltransferase
MIGTDIDPQNFSHANQNIERNELTSRIRTKLNIAEDALISPKTFDLDKLDFVMCNPPFYSSAEDMATSSAGKSGPPSAVCTGAEVEMICPGGDAGFVLRMVEESKELKDTVRWYTSMLGKLSSVHQVIDRLKEIGINNWAVTLLRAGNKTRRWAVGWSYGDRRPSNVSSQQSFARNLGTNRYRRSLEVVMSALTFYLIQQLRLSIPSDSQGKKLPTCSTRLWKRSI